MPKNVPSFKFRYVLLGVGIALFIVFFVMDFVNKNKIDAKVLVPLIFVGGSVLLFSVVSAVGLYRMKRITSYPVITPLLMPRHIGQRVIVNGKATGEIITSPWSKIKCVYTEAKKVVYRKGADNKVDRDEYFLGHAGELGIMADNSPATVVLETETFTLLHIPEANQSSSFVTEMIFSSLGDGIVETPIPPGRELWVTGVVGENGSQFSTEEWIQVSGKDQKGQLEFVRIITFISLGMTAFWSIMLLVLLFSS